MVPNVGSTVFNQQAPSSWEVQQYYDRQNQMRAQKDQQDADREDRRQQALAGYVGDAFNDNNFATGTQYDPIIQKQLSENRLKYLNIIKNQKDISHTELASMIEKDMLGVSGTTSQVKALKGAIDSQFDQFKGMKGLDVAGMKAIAIKDGLYNTDGSLKKPEEINPNVDYASYVLDNHFDKVITADDSDIWVDYLKGQPKETVGNSYEAINSRGAREKKTYSYDMYRSFQDVIHDPKTNESAVKTRTNPNKVDLGNGKPTEIIAEDIYSGFIQNPVNKGYLNKQLLREFPGVKPNSDEAELLKRKILLDRFKTFEPQGKKSVVEKAAPIIINNSKDKEDEPTLEQKLNNQTPDADGNKDLQRHLGKWIFKREKGKDVFAEDARVDKNNVVHFNMVDEFGGRKPAQMGYDEFLSASRAFNPGTNIRKKSTPVQGKDNKPDASKKPKISW